MTDPIQPFKDRLEQARQLAANRLLRSNYYGNVVGVGIGKKMSGGVSTPTDCIRVYVVAKCDLEDVSPAALIPGDFLDVPTDIIEVGRFGQGGHRPTPLPDDAVVGPGDPIRVSTQASNVNSGSLGTLGAIVQDVKGQRYILSCNHVLAVNGRVPKGANIVSTLTAKNETTLAARNAFIRFDREEVNLVDCALALRGDPKLVDETFQERNPQQPRGIPWKSDKPIKPAIKMKVDKVGAVTGRTSGVIVDVDVELYVDYSFGTFRFEKQVMIDGGEGSLFARGGDSGSIVVDTKSGQATAMVFAASGRYAVACPIDQVLNDLANVPDELGNKVGALTLCPWAGVVAD
jgi:hypothetical protein